MIKSYEIKSEADAWKFLEEALEEEAHTSTVDFSFKTWPAIDINLKGDNFQSSLTSQSMEGLVEFQKIINKTYAHMRYNGSASRLKNDEKKDLEITYKVSEGSTEIKVDFTQAATKMAEGMVNNMTGTEMVITVLGSLFIGSCAYGLNRYIASQQQNKLADTIKSQSEEETKRTKILTDAMTRTPKLKEIQEEADETYNKVLRGLQEADTLTVDGKTFDYEEIKAIIRTPRSKSTEVQLNGNYRVEKIDNSQDGEFIVFVTDHKSDLAFTAKLEDSFFVRKENSKEHFTTAIIDRTTVYLKINAKMLRGQVINATIVGVDTEKNNEDE